MNAQQARELSEKAALGECKTLEYRVSRQIEEACAEGRVSIHHKLNNTDSHLWNRFINHLQVLGYKVEKYDDHDPRDGSGNNYYLSISW